MKPTIRLLLFLPALSSLLHPTASVCVPRAPITPSVTLPFPITANSPTKPPPPATPSGSIDHILRSFCNHTDFADLCFKSIKQADPNMKDANNNTVLAALMNSVEAKTHEARAFARKLSSDPAIDAKTRHLLRDCVDTYEDALDDLDSAEEAIRAGDAGTRDSMLSAMISNYGTCEDGFQEFNIKSPMAEWSKTLQHMTDNCLAIININKPMDDY